MLRPYSGLAFGGSGEVQEQRFARTFLARGEAPIPLGGGHFAAPTVAYFGGGSTEARIRPEARRSMDKMRYRNTKLPQTIRMDDA